MSDRGAVAQRRPLTSPSRLAGVDLARGLAVLGMLAAHLADIPDVVWTDPATWGGIVHGRSSILFATLAGVSLGIVSGGRHPAADLGAVRARLGVRAVLLWAIGMALVSTGVPVLVILPAYAVMFLLALPLLSLTARPLAALAAVLALVSPFAYAALMAGAAGEALAGTATGTALGWDYPFLVWMSFVVAGLATARAGLSSPRTAALLAGGGAALAMLGYGLAAMPAPAPWLEPVWTAAPHSSGLLEVVGSGGFALAVLGLCVLLCRTPAGSVLLPIRAVGSMPLTAYVGQLVAWAILAAVILGDTGDLAGFRAQNPLGWFVAVTIVACTAWALLVGRGPLEWALARVTALMVRF